MPLPAYALPYGLRDVKLRSITNGVVSPTAVDLPAGRTFSFTESEEYEELRGDDQVIASHGSGPQVEWEIEGGGISLEAYAMIAGGTVSSSGVEGNLIKTYNKKVTQARPYFQVEGQAISDNGGDFHCLIYRAKATDDIEGELSDGSFWVTSAGGTGFPDADGNVYDFIQNEVETAITTA